MMSLVSPLAYKLPLVFGYGAPHGFGWWMIWISVRAGSGWLVARLHREHATAMVLAFSGSVLLWKLQLLPWTCHLLVDAVNDPRYRGELLGELMTMILPSVSILLGGLWGGSVEGSLSAQNARIAT
jgi:hypothetical protein